MPDTDTVVCDDCDRVVHRDDATVWPEEGVAQCESCHDAYMAEMHRLYCRIH